MEANSHWTGLSLFQDELMASTPGKPLVSVIVPNYNHAKFLGPRLESVFAQTFQDFEVIYLDDASNDNSNEVANSFNSDPRMSMVLNQENSGSPFVQWNKGVSMAKGDLIWIAESDDRA
ncbi:MAG: glycosyltransferase involved in cell wall biosynthesis, partial [Planctomycetota bacterium]